MSVCLCVCHGQNVPILEKLSLVLRGKTPKVVSTLRSERDTQTDMQTDEHHQIWVSPGYKISYMNCHLKIPAGHHLIRCNLVVPQGLIV